MKSYSERLRDPRWQKKRLEIMERDEFACRVCFDSQSTLNVHHCYYRPGAMPWEYESTSLLTLCEDCHKVETRCLKTDRLALLDVMGQRGALSRHINELMVAFTESCQFDDPWISALAFAISCPDVRSLIMDIHAEILSGKVRGVA